MVKKMKKLLSFFLVFILVLTPVTAFASETEEKNSIISLDVFDCLGNVSRRALRQ